MQPVTVRRWEVVAAFFALVITATAVALWNGHRIDNAEKRINRNTVLALSAYAKAKDANATSKTLCVAVIGARNFWIGVRDTTIELLKDPDLSPIVRESNVHYLQRLNAVIGAASDLASTCPR